LLLTEGVIADFLIERLPFGRGISSLLLTVADIALHTLWSGVGHNRPLALQKVPANSLGIAHQGKTATYRSLRFSHWQPDAVGRHISI
jgi:hypothetical protein